MKNSLFKELKRRNVFKVGAAYVIVSWLILQVLSSIMPMLDLPEVFGRMVLVFLFIGLPIALVFAWAFEMTAEGVKATKDVAVGDSITQSTSQKINYIIIGALVLIIAGFVYNKFSPGETQTNAVNTVDETGAQTQNSKPQKPAVQNPSLNNNTIPVETESSSKAVKEKSVAVLPFTNMSAENKNESFALGIHDDLLTHLSKISALKVISRTSVLRYKGTEEPIAEIAKELGVKNILEGSVQTAGQQIRINVQLIDAQTDEHLWAEIYDRKLTVENIFIIQTEISIKIAAALKAQLSPEEETSLAKQATNNLNAYNAYITARQLMVSRTSADLKQALGLFEQATKLDSNYALAYVGQADALLLLTRYSALSNKDYLTQAEPLITKALELNPRLAEAHTAKAFNLQRKNQLVEAEKSFKYSLSLNPNYATTYQWYGILLSGQGHYQQSLNMVRKAAALDPLSPTIQLNVATALSLLGQPEEALAQLHRIIKFAPDFSLVNVSLADSFLNLGRPGEAGFWMNKAVALDKGNAQIRLNQVRVYSNLGDVEMADKLLLELKSDFPDSGWSAFVQIMIYVGKGKYNDAYQLATSLSQQQPDNPQFKYALAFSAILVDNYSQARDLYLDILTTNKDSMISVDATNFDEMIWLAYSYKKLKQKEQYQQLLAQLKQALLTLPENDIYRQRVYIETIQGNNKAAAVAYAQMIENNKYRDWWINESLLTTETKQEPVYIKARQLLMDKLKAQREILTKLELDDKAD